MVIIIVAAFSSDSDKDKFDLIFNKYKNLMLYKAYEILKDPYLAEDAVSDAFLRIYKNIHKISDPLSNRSVAFIITIVRNTALTMSKKAGRVRNETVDEDVWEDIRDESIDIETSVLSGLAAENIYKIIDGLSEKYKQVFLLKYAYDYSHKEIGKLLDMTEGNVTVTLHRAKKMLTVLLSEHNEHGEQVKKSVQGKGNNP